jgi:thiamine-phosphate pyrophosphorylase
MELGRSLREATSRTKQLLLVSDRTDLALELGADGVHLPARGLLPSHIEHLRPGGIISRAHHDAEDLPMGELGRCAFLLVSPAFEPRKGRPALLTAGLRARFAVLRALAPRTRLLALGGVDAQTSHDALAAGADGVAAIWSAHDAGEQAALVQLLGIGRATS